MTSKQLKGPTLAALGLCAALTVLGTTAADAGRPSAARHDWLRSPPLLLRSGDRPARPAPIADAARPPAERAAHASVAP